MGSVGRCTNAARRGALLVLALLAALAALAIPASSSATDGINLRIDLETGNSSQFSGLECAHPATQFQVYTAGTPGYPDPRQGTYAARFSETPSDVWSGNNMVRCLGARYDSGESAGNNYYYGFSLYIPSTGLGPNLIWELHHPSSLYSLSACGVAPFAVLASSGGGLQFRISTGNCTVGSGYAYWYPHIALPGLEVAPRNTWIDFMIHIAFSETSGTTEVSYRVGNNAWPASPQLARYGIPTLPYANSANVHNVTLYTEMGLYTGYTPYTSSDSIFLDGYRRGTSSAAVMAEFPGSGSAPLVVAPVVSSVPVVSGSAADGGVLSSTAGAWSNSPVSYGYVWQSSRDGGATWQAVAGATSSTLSLVDGLVGASVRSVVTATNAAGSGSAVSAATAVVAPPAIVQNIVAGQTMSGTVNWTATPSMPVKQVVFAMDGNKVTYTDTTAPFSYQLDTTKLANGTHTLGLTVTLLDGTVVWQPYQIGTVTVSNAPAVITPVSTSVPVVSGSAADGGLLSSTAGAWSNAPASYGYVWQSSRDGGATWQAVAGATSSTLSLVDGLVGASVRSVVTATNSAGSASAVSAATAVVAPPVIVQNIVAGQTLSGTVAWTATPSVPVKQVVFALDGNKITYCDTGAPFSYQLDTTKLANGTHTLGLTVTLLDGTVIWQPYQIGTVTVSNLIKRRRANG